jgi:hypothetical protein
MTSVVQKYFGSSKIDHLYILSGPAPDRSPLMRPLPVLYALVMIIANLTAVGAAAFGLAWLVGLL